MREIASSEYLYKPHSQTIVRVDLLNQDGALAFRRDRKAADRLARKAKRNGNGPRHLRITR